MVSNTYEQHGAYIGYILLNKCVPKWVTISDNLFTKHSTHMAYILKPLVRKFRIL